MTKKRTARAGQPEILALDVAIQSLKMVVRLSAVHRRGAEPYAESKPWLELRGKALERVRGVEDVLVSMYPEDEVRIGTARPASIGAVLRARPELHFVLSWPHLGFD